MPMIRAAGPEDYDGACVVLRELDDVHAGAMPHFFRYGTGPARTREWFSESLDDPDTLLLAAEQGGQIVGVLTAEVRESPALPMFVPRRWLLINEVAVLRAYRRMGIGRALVQHADAWATAKGLTEVELTVWSFNENAAAFYAALGYAPIVTRLWKRIG